MNTPSNELKATADEPKPNPEHAIREWALLLNKLRIKHGGIFIFGVSAQLAREANCELLTEMESTYDSTLEVMLMSQPQQLISRENVDDPIWAHFMRDGQAVIEHNSTQVLDPVATSFIGFRGTWEEVARKLFELESLMLAKASVAEVPSELKS